MLSLGALIGDLTESFIKRRIGFPPGASLPVADQLDFVAGALLFLPTSFTAHFTSNLNYNNNYATHTPFY